MAPAALVLVRVDTSCPLEQPLLLFLLGRFPRHYGAIPKSSLMISRMALKQIAGHLCSPRMTRIAVNVLGNGFSSKIGKGQNSDPA